MKEMFWEHMKGRKLEDNKVSITVVNTPSYITC